MSIVKPIVMPTMNSIQDIRNWMQKVCDRLSYQTDSGSPITGNVLPRWIGDRYLRSSNDNWYMAYGTAAGEWKNISIENWTELPYTRNLGSPIGSVTPNGPGHLLYDYYNNVWYLAYDTDNTDWTALT